MKQSGSSRPFRANRFSQPTECSGLGGGIILGDDRSQFAFAQLSDAIWIAKVHQLLLDRVGQVEEAHDLRHPCARKPLLSCKIRHPKLGVAGQSGLPLDSLMDRMNHGNRGRGIDLDVVKSVPRKRKRMRDARTGAPAGEWNRDDQRCFKCGSFSIAARGAIRLACWRTLRSWRGRGGGRDAARTGGERRGCGEAKGGEQGREAAFIWS